MSQQPQAPNNNRRVSLACVPCRSKHLRCDATTPVCTRCRSEGLQCVYLKSRRGGRRPRQPSTHISTDTCQVSQISPGLPSQQQLPAPADDPLSNPNPARSTSSEDDRSHSDRATSVTVSMHSENMSDSSLSEQFFSQYYSYFHAAQPCMLPLWALKQRMATDGRPLQTLVSVVQYIGSVFAKSVISASMKVEAEQAVASIGMNGPATGFDVQALVLLSIAVYWANEPEKALNMLDRSIALALELGMNRRGFAYAHGQKDPMLEECWRRTWWQLYITDAHIAGSTSTFPFRTSNVEMDVDLPCDEEFYESGNIPRVRTLQDYDMREFLDEEDRVFSSFAELVGLTRSLDLALAARQNMTSATAPAVCANTDASVTAWRSLLPHSKRDLVRGDGSVDELLFKANIIIHTYVVDLHRQLSTLAYSPIEAIAHCAPNAPPESLRGCNSTECQLHTAKVLRAIDQFDELLTLPTNIATHTPFIICMIANTVIAHLSACRFHYQGHQLKLARERIRLSMGALKVLGEYWPMGLRTYKEVGIVAREILGLKDQQQKNVVEVSTREITVPPVVPEYVPPTQQVPVSFPQQEMHEIPMYMDQPSLEDFQLLETSFDFCGLFDMSMASIPVL
ncbi:hypothetical protein ASPCAL01622 [Aspergillus calidoustus]|uniref:Zn(2)-C6 fungal-type domain-containing protein n=1 Tax=Aspergillus calidoustus TaxID=454130 RepID=A0A0U5FY63_ASPCI|nr:hypothetical protein ASPCAL01622 [Aspergillus calidoustus]